MNAQSEFPQIGYVRLRQILAVLPMGRTKFLLGVKSGLYPKPKKLGPKLNAWPAAEIRKLLENLPEVQGAPAPPLPKCRRAVANPARKRGRQKAMLESTTPLASAQ